MRSPVILKAICGDSIKTEANSQSTNNYPHSKPGLQDTETELDGYDKQGNEKRGQLTSRFRRKRSHQRKQNDPEVNKGSQQKEQI